MFWPAKFVKCKPFQAHSAPCSHTRSLSQVLSDENRALLDVIRTSRPASISELSDLTGRKQGNLSRTLKTMSRYGLVRMEKSNRSVRPIAQAQGYQIMA